MLVKKIHLKFPPWKKMFTTFMFGMNSKVRSHISRGQTAEQPQSCMYNHTYIYIEREGGRENQNYKNIYNILQIYRGFPNSHAWWHSRLPLLRGRTLRRCSRALRRCCRAERLSPDWAASWTKWERKTVKNWDWTLEKLGKTMENLKLSGEVFISENHHHHFYPRFPNRHSHLALDTQLHPLYTPNCPAELSKITCL